MLTLGGQVMRDRGELEVFLGLGVTESMWSARTHEAYRRDLELYLEFLDELGIDSLGESDEHAIMGFLATRRAQGDAPATLARRQAALRSFHRHLMREGVISRNVLDRLPAGRRERRLPHFLSLPEMDRLLETTAGDAPLALRDRALVETLYATGIRVSELVGLDAADLVRADDLESIKVLGKGGKERFVPIHATAAGALRAYLERGRPRLARVDSPGALFLGRSGHGLGRNAVFKRLRRLGLAAGIAQPVTPHLLRHTFATHLLHEGADMRSIQEMLGHANLETTTIYTSVDTERLRRVHRRAHPRG